MGTLTEHGDGKTVINIHCGQSLEIYLFFFLGGVGGETYNCFLFDPSELFVKIM